MNIKFKNNDSIIDFESWKEAFTKVDSKHWEEGRSACRLARYFTAPNLEESDGIKLIKEYFEALGFSNPKFESADIEHASPFDEYSRPRMQDLVIWGESEKGRILACIEAKVDEKFGNEVLNQAYKNAKQYKIKHPNSNRQKRIEELCDTYLNVSAESIKSGDENNIRYQLLHYLAGSICEAKEYGNVVFMPIMVFKTNKYNETKGKRNRKAYERFIKVLKFDKCKTEKPIFKRTFDNIDVYISYIEINFKK